MIKNLLTIKSIVTLVLTADFTYLIVTGGINAEQFLSIFTMIIGFYFGTQKLKDYDSKERDEAYEDEDPEPMVVTMPTPAYDAVYEPGEEQYVTR